MRKTAHSARRRLADACHDPDFTHDSDRAPAAGNAALWPVLSGLRLRRPHLAIIGGAALCATSLAEIKRHHDASGRA
ncbi:hypothetical protein [Agrobacterium pusense]|uniref:hypothetical protein n=1 Tax=Agrobacterium pusense TaxID=648995 RepID=UPI00244A648E|nr:hypothetical protein [Agrobacterium pusense]MDH0873655.1 hypothetical protein [Agrobacterium pusense]